MVTSASSWFLQRPVQVSPQRFSAASSRQDGQPICGFAMDWSGKQMNQQIPVAPDQGTDDAGQIGEVLYG